MQRFSSRYADMKKRLLIATDAFPPRWDGIARFLAEIIPELVDYFDITVVAPAFPGMKVEEEMKGITVVRVPTFSFKFGDYYPPRFPGKVLAQFMKNAEVVWIHALMPIGITAIRLAKKRGIPVIATVHSIEKLLALHSLSEKNPFRVPASSLVQLVVRHLYNKCSMLTVPSREILDAMTWQGIKTTKTLIPLGVDTDRFRPLQDKKAAKLAVDIDPSSKVIGYCGRLAREKDLPTLYRAFVRVEKKYPDITLLIVGDGIDDIKRQLSRKANVKVVGSVDNVVPYLQAMDINVLPSLTETSSLSTMEAMSCELAVVATPVGLVKEYITEGKNGLFFPKRDTHLLTRQLLHLLEQPRLIMEYGQEARKTMVRHYGLERTVEQFKTALSVV
ncbi:glycosyltransferase [Candidatus Woesearchaeota archaeon]|nr:glycosyltransferase [Candidatus Woesearchaeota archaeon]